MPELRVERLSLTINCKDLGMINLKAMYTDVPQN